ncbi:MAG: hypothetical protein M1819_004630 [Sarea resinae]|nr:MAG: hypothetical protein M1819_004630 [Sarea resinae]
MNDLDRHKKSLHRARISHGSEKSHICAAPTCKKKRRLWPRLDNFRQHIRRMHPEMDVDVLLQQSVVMPELLPQPGSVEELPFEDDDANDSNVPSFTRSGTHPRSPSRRFGQGRWDKTSREGRKSHTNGPSRRGPPRKARERDEVDKKQRDATGQYPAYSAAPETRDLANDRSPTASGEMLFDAQNNDTTGHPDSTRLSVSRRPLSANDIRGVNSTECRERRYRRQNTSTAAQSQDTPLLDDSSLESRSPWADSQSNATVSALHPPTLANVERYWQRSQDIPNRVEGNEQWVSVDDRQLRQQSSGLQSLWTLEADTRKGVKCKHCPKVLPRQSDMNKHQKRHLRPYGCTYVHVGCHKAFGSKNDWKRHENGRHYQQELWRCHESVIDGAGKTRSTRECARPFHRREAFQNHLRSQHMIDSAAKIKEECQLRRIGRNCQDRFWCGFCEDIIPLRGRSREAWDERADHICNHFNEGLRMVRWVPVYRDSSKDELEDTDGESDLDDADSHIEDDQIQSSSATVEAKPAPPMFTPTASSFPLAQQLSDYHIETGSSVSQVSPIAQHGFHPAASPSTHHIHGQKRPPVDDRSAANLEPAAKRQSRERDVVVTCCKCHAGPQLIINTSRCTGGSLGDWCGGHEFCRNCDFRYRPTESM